MLEALGRVPYVISVIFVPPISEVTKGELLELVKIFASTSQFCLSLVTTKASFR